MLWVCKAAAATVKESVSVVLVLWFNPSHNWDHTAARSLPPTSVG